MVYLAIVLIAREYAFFYFALLDFYLLSYNLLLKLTSLASSIFLRRLKENFGAKARVSVSVSMKSIN